MWEREDRIQCVERSSAKEKIGKRGGGAELVERAGKRA